MKHIKAFKVFEKNISYIKQNVNIRVDIDASRHAMERFLRHDPLNPIEEGDVIDVVERSIEELTIALMQNRLNIEEKFILKDKFSDLHIVANLYAGENEFTMVIITVMVEKNFRRKENFFLEI